MSFKPNTKFYGRRVTIYDTQSLLEIGYLDAILDPNTFVVDGVTFYTKQSDNFCVDGDEIVIYDAVIVQ